MSENPGINQQFQSLHVNGESTKDWIKIQIIEKDICLLYHQLSNYSYVMDDLYYGDVFSLPYWNFLDIKGIDEERRQFIREGSLVFIFAMVTEEVGGSGCYLSLDKERFRMCKAKIESCKSENENEELLLESIRTGFKLIENNNIGDTSIYANSTEIHKRIVREYFVRKSKDFESNEYFKDKK